MTEKRYIYASVGVSFEILDSWFGYTGDEEPTEREIEEYDYLVIGIAPDKDSADGICRRLNDQQDEINELCNSNLHMVLDERNKEINELKMEVIKQKKLIKEKETLIECLFNELRKKPMLCKSYEEEEDDLQLDAGQKRNI